MIMFIHFYENKHFIWSLVKCTNKVSQISKNGILIFCYILIFLMKLSQIRLVYYSLNSHVQSDVPCMFANIYEIHFKCHTSNILFFITSSMPTKQYSCISLFICRNKRSIQQQGQVNRIVASTISAKSWHTDTATLADVLF